MSLSDIEWLALVAKSYLQPPVPFRDTTLPGFPPDQIQTNTTGDAGLKTLTEAFIFYEDCAAQFRRLGRPLGRDSALLDFGVGWGRIARFFLKDVAAQNIFGIDVSPEMIEICRQTWRSNNFIVTNPFPPTPIPDARFDFITGYSVFSHLSEQACAAWMDEFHRILRPNGIVALTTRSRQFLDVCEALKQQNVTGYAKAMSEIFGDFDAARERYDRGEFVHSNIDGVSGGGAMNASFYGETFIPEEYARTAYAEKFHLETFLYDPARQTHPIMVFSKKSDV